MANSSDFKIKKIEKGPLQRFKNQNLLIKKFGELGLQVYKAITGKRTTQELRKDLGIEASLFDQMINYMQDAGMIELSPAGVAGKGRAEEEAGPEEEKTLEELPPEEEEEEKTKPLEEQPQEKGEEEGAASEEEIAPEEITSVEEEERPKPSAKKKAPRVEEEIFPEEEIKPIHEEESSAKEEKPAARKKKYVPAPAEEIAPEEEIGEEIAPVEEAPAEEEKEGGLEIEGEPEKEEKEEKEEEGIASLDEEEKPAPESDLSPVEKIISDKYGDIGLRVYTLIDGQRTAEEIMVDTGLTEAKLVEILDFMDEQGIIKLDYPKGGGASGPSAKGPAEAPPPPAAAVAKKEEGFVPLTEGEESLDEARGVSSPVEMPIKAPLDLVKSVQMKAKMMLKYGDKGSKIIEGMDGKNDAIDISLKVGMPLYDVYDVLNFMMGNGMIIMKPLTRADVRKKYGDDGYSVYKKYGKEGLMLYELIGKDMSIKQMADKIMKDKSKIVDMFVFIHKVLGIELPIDRNVLAKQLGI